jgi:protoporphyrinogen oxidase
VGSAIKEGGCFDSTRPSAAGRDAVRLCRARPGGSRAGARIVVLGGGITGLTVAWELSRRSDSPILLIEKSAGTGGLAGSLRHGDRVLDFGSHRIHEQYDPEVFCIIKELLGDDLLKRPRRGQIWIQGRFLDYPPSPAQVLTSFGFSKGARLFWDFLTARGHLALAPGRGGRLDRQTSFEEYATGAVGKSLYDSFYKPYALKLWGVAPARLSFEPAVSRVRKFEARAVWKEVKRKVTGETGGRSFYYPAKGFGQIAEKIRERFIENGGEILFESSVERLELKNGVEVEAVLARTGEGPLERIPTEVFISTAPINVLHRLICSALDVNEGSGLGLSWRSLRILYLFTPDKITSEHETYYFPEPDVIFGRVSEPAKYSPFLSQPVGKSALVIEIPCAFGDEIWNMEDEALAGLCIRDLRELKILSAKTGGPSEHYSRKIKNLYPVYELGWRENLDNALRRFNLIENLYPIGRPALFLHCNVDHCMVMALKLARFLSAGGGSREDWERSLGDVFSLSLHD